MRPLLTNAPRWALIISGILVATPALAGDDLPDDYVSSQAIVKLEPGISIQDINADYGTSVLAAIEAQNIYLLELPALMDEDAFENLLDDDERVDCADLNYENAVPGGSTQSFFFNVPQAAFASQYAWAQVNLAQAQKVSTGGGVIVALLDTGIDALHPMLEGMVLPDGFNFLDGSSDVSELGNGVDDDADGAVDEMVGHGTYMAGIIAHMAPDAELLPIKVLDSDGASNSFSVAQGIYYAIDHGATIINLSLGSTNDSELIARAVQDAHADGIVVLAAAGNANALDPPVFPAADPHVIGVAATNQSDLKAPFSNFGQHVAISAPGVEIIGAFPGNQYAQGDGTSPATALVTGAVALLKAANPTAPPDQVRSLLAESADDLDILNPDYVGLLGTGRVDVGGALGVETIGDLNADNIVGVADLLLLISAWGQTSSPADLTGDGAVNIDDLLVLLSHWS